MKITLRDKQGKEMTFETLHPVEEFTEWSDTKTLECEEWILTSGTNNWLNTPTK